MEDGPAGARPDKGHAEDLAAGEHGLDFRADLEQFGVGFEQRLEPVVFFPKHCRRLVAVGRCLGPGEAGSEASQPREDRAHGRTPDAAGSGARRRLWRFPFCARWTSPLCSPDRPSRAEQGGNHGSESGHCHTRRRLFHRHRPVHRRQTAPQALGPVHQKTVLVLREQAGRNASGGQRAVPFGNPPGVSLVRPYTLPRRRAEVEQEKAGTGRDRWCLSLTETTVAPPAKGQCPLETHKNFGLWCMQARSDLRYNLNTGLRP
ncbi:hypothetical protein DVDV_3125 [Desulfovibrio sp. DV]|nr:hypothetical protein DVDV_3125 [Desulfovibrio sp. DV]